MNEALRLAMVAAEGAGELAGEGVLSGRAEHPVCGDVVEVDVRLRDGRVEALAWRAHGCPACMAVASVSPALRGGRADQAGPRLRARLAELGDLAAHERHAERLFLDALTRALATAESR